MAIPAIDAITKRPRYPEVNAAGQLRVEATVGAPMGGATEAKQDTQLTVASASDAKLASLVAALAPILKVEPLGQPGVPRQIAAVSSSTNVVLTPGVTRVSLYARGADLRYSVAAASTVASATSHFIAAGERLDVRVPSTGNLAVIRAGGVDGTLELSELV